MVAYLVTKDVASDGCLSCCCGLENGAAPYRSAKPPTPQSARESAQRGAGQKRGVLGEVLGKVLAPCVSFRNKEDEHFPKHFPEHPVSGRHLSEHSPEQFLGGWWFCASVGGRPVLNCCPWTGADSCRSLS